MTIGNLTNGVLASGMYWDVLPMWNAPEHKGFDAAIIASLSLKNKNQNKNYNLTISYLLVKSCLKHFFKFSTKSK